MNTTSHESEKPAKGQQVITAYAFIHHNFDGVEKLFVPKRAGTKKFLPGVFELPGGHIDFGETTIDGLKREIFEEFGIHVIIGDPFYVFTYINDVKGSHSIEVIYFAAFEDAIEKINLDPAVHSQLLWIAENELSQILTKEKGEQDPEIKAIKRGFELLRGSKINTL
ncbi:MAG: hypothetical protein A3G49_00165 [Candidatus Sungbacteria bacterium RIFCSPLOWO2_12_FULL_41_11]|uniref:Nudix hydrolase domain-containing protein n=1 Tax=Candidatus Sungbacteria bacterium RIFCSPLOWO2_12_FULL_41_11 TaxID=1802286 RepID=A0A1G2LM36_9BACT|nr:MAG: hypothetical protein UV01_C0005G0042 [Parcubacteria group bacterium GW2011_GWA2_42_14]OGZ99789.1 MAG: hypothetical protein A3D41_04470 [Candidatus Sungbacteria bacterium RIFCSPHIGHO2_02_FULL_41_12b]OHA12675.1 MAG: hypothetical protein A3G49_00165 [Candidatus Sungbacteria bacterium RIFCSPLOWO2_12_FULL_41_11]